MAKAATKKRDTNAPQEQTIPFAAEIGKVLQLMIHSLYTNKDIFLRELISNASDACDRLRYAALTDAGLQADDTALGIRISFDEKAGTLTVTDNGIGMNHDELINNLGTIARSGTQEFAAALETLPPLAGGDGGGSAGHLPGTQQEARVPSPNPSREREGDVINLIGQFGVGFYASFMVADKVTVHTRKAGETESWQWESDGTGSFTVSPASDHPRGTRITLHMKGEGKEYLDKHKLRHIVETYSDHIGFPITLIDAEGNSDTINTASAIWTRPKSEISDEQYQEFYRHVAHSPDKPWAVLHNKAEGALEYTNLLFIPSLKPFDLFNPERRKRVKLYVKRVFITDEGVDIIPAYLRFLRGVIDSADLPLNISRETLQKNAIIDRIRDSVTSRVLGELKKRAEKDIADYTGFWNNFGAVLKEGLCEPTSQREKILEASRFYSTTSPDTLMSLDDYIGRMQEGQDAIYYLIGDSVAALKASPQIEGFAKRGIEVLLLTDHVDDFWVNVTLDYKGNRFRSVIKSGEDLKKSDAPKAEPTPEIAKLIAAMKTLYGDQVKDVRITDKLAESPVCLAVGEGDMDMRMERFLLEHKQLPARQAKILEINPTHPVISKLAAQVGDKAEGDTAEALWLLLDQAKIAEGEPVNDLAAYTRRVTALLGKVL